MACPGGWNVERNIGATFCQGSCGGSKKLEWQKKEYTYASGSKCTADEYVGCC
ncbi:hypothetical protein ACFVT8_09265 [Lysinibacillus sp. NPDC058147]|uniref:hypothetical protein n=1 Tax=unclassified Lysinibacillus TaxID=2636778 RepID=UPI0036DE09C0